MGPGAGVLEERGGLGVEPGVGLLDGAVAHEQERRLAEEADDDGSADLARALEPAVDDPAVAAGRDEEARGVRGERHLLDGPDAEAEEPHGRPRGKAGAEHHGGEEERLVLLGGDRQPDREHDGGDREEAGLLAGPEVDPLRRARREGV